jgi:putative transposase
MKGKRFSEEQIMRILHDAEAMGNVREVCRQHNIAEQTLYRWRRQFGGMEVADAKRLRTLERANAALKRLVGELTLDNRMRKDVLGKNWEAWLPGAKRQHIWSRRTPSASDAPAASGRSTAAQNGGSQAHGTRWS